MHGGRRYSIFLAFGLGLLACQDDVTADGDESSDVEPSCPVERAVDVHFQYNTASQLESDSCELTEFGPSLSDPSKVVVGTSCGYRIELAGVSPPTIEIEVGDSIQVETSVDDPLAMDLGCAENGWLSIQDTLGRTQLVVVSVADVAAPLSLGDLGELELQQGWIDGCRVLQLRAQGDEASVRSRTSTEVELAGVNLLVQLGLFQDSSGASCGIERYSVVMFRLPD
jgi:hypothetical protein